MLYGVLVVAVLLATVAGLAFWSRRGETSVDPPGIRSLVTFRSGDDHITPGERDAEKRNGRGALGRGFITVLAERLRERGLSVEAPAPDDYGWALTVRANRVAAHLLLGAMEDDADPKVAWALSVVDGAGKPGPRGVLQHVDAALRQVPNVEDVTWHKRERHLAGDLSSGSERPIED